MTHSKEAIKIKKTELRLPFLLKEWAT